MGGANREGEAYPWSASEWNTYRGVACSGGAGGPAQAAHLSFRRGCSLRGAVSA